MNNSKNVYCRLCAELKPHNELANLQTDEETCQKVVNKLSRFNIMLDFQENELPMMVCLLCVQSLERAFSFITAVEKAQTFLSTFILVQTRTEKRDADGEFAFDISSDVSQDVIDIKVDSGRDSVDVSDYDPNLGEECDVQNVDGIEEVRNEFRDPTKSYGFNDEEINKKDESGECTNVKNPEAKCLNFSNDCLEYRYTYVIENDFEIQHSNTTNSKLKEFIKGMYHTSEPNLQLDSTVHSEDDINKLNDDSIGAGVPHIHKEAIGGPDPPKLLDTTVYSEDYISEQINSLGKIPVQCLKMTWMDYEWECSHCGTLFSNIEELQKHSMQHHNICNAYQCTNCKIKKQRLNAFIKHVRAHRKYLHYSCYRCFEKFPNIKDKIQHTSKMHENSKYVCVGCNTPFASNTEMEEHVNKYYNVLWSRKIFINKDNLTCSTCNKAYASVAALRNHLNRHKEKKRDRICDRCGKCFDSAPSLKAHMDIHSERVLYRCEICKTTFKNVYTLRNHASIHSGIKPFTCDVCSKCFRTKIHIRNHMKSHMDYFPITCKVCSKKFRNEILLKRHMLQHTGEKPFSCDICPRDFTNMSNRNKHMRRRHGIEMAKKRQPIIKQQTADDPTASVLVTGEAKTADLEKKI